MQSSQSPAAPQSPAAAEPQQPAVVEWGGQRTGMFERLISIRGWHPAVPWVLAGLGAVAMFGSLVGEWQIVEPNVPDDYGFERQAFGLGFMLVWGAAWIVGSMLLAACGGLVLAGQPSIRRHARTIGLAVAGAQLGILLGAAVSLDTESLFTGVDPGVEITLGRGVYAAFASVLLIGAALYLARGEQIERPRPRLEPVAVEGPADLTIGPAEPVVRSTDTLQG